MFLKLPFIGSAKLRETESTNYPPRETESSNNVSGPDQSKTGSTKAPTKASMKTSEGQEITSRKELQELSKNPNHQAGDKAVSGDALKFTEMPQPLQYFLIKNLGVKNPELQKQMIITEPSKINTNGELTSQFVITLAPESAAKLLKKGPLHFLSKLNPFRNKAFDKAELNKLAEQIHTNTIPKINHEIASGKVTVQLLINFNETKKQAEIAGLALSHCPVDFIHEHPGTLKIMEHLKKELPMLEKKLLSDKELKPESREFIERSLTDLNSFVNLNPKALDREITAHAKGFIVLEHLARTGKEKELIGKAARDDGREIEVTNFAENLMKRDGNWLISMLGENLEEASQGASLKWRGVNINNPKEVIDRHHSFIKKYPHPYLDPRIALLSSISEMLFHGKHLPEKQIKQALIANVESTIKYNLTNNQKNGKLI
ncbi:MAG: hypothetical protein ACKO3R_02100 [bacterium]